MNISTINSDIKELEKALKLVESTENYFHFSKSEIMLILCREINILKEKRDNQIEFMRNPELLNQYK